VALPYCHGRHHISGHLTRSLNPDQPYPDQLQGNQSRIEDLTSRIEGTMKRIFAERMSGWNPDLQLQRASKQGESCRARVISSFVPREGGCAQTLRSTLLYSMTRALAEYRFVRRHGACSSSTYW
jgi:hypothetical protein